MSEEEFEDIFGNIPFENIKKIQKYIKDNYISKDKIREKIKKYKKMRDCDYNYMSIMYNKLNAVVQVLQELLEEE